MQFYGRFACFRFPSRLFTDVNRKSHCLNGESLEVHQIQRHLVQGGRKKVKGGSSHKSLLPSSKVTFSSLFAGLKTWIGTSKVLWSDKMWVGAAHWECPGHKSKASSASHEKWIYTKPNQWASQRFLENRLYDVFFETELKGGKKEPLSRSFF